MFERAARFANDLGLLARRVDPATGGQLGKAPQIGVVNAAWKSRKRSAEHARDHALSCISTAGLVISRGPARVRVPLAPFRVTTLSPRWCTPNTSSEQDRRHTQGWGPQTAACIIPYHSSQLAASPLLIVHSAGVGRGGSGAGGARSRWKFRAGALIWPARQKLLPLGP